MYPILLTTVLSFVPIKIPVPFPLTLYLTSGKKVSHVICDQTMEEPLSEAFACIKDLGHIELIYHGCYNYRNIAGTSRLSKHAYGRAIDLNASIPIPEKVVQCFKQAGFIWGGDWPNKTDPMHFELP